MAIIKFEPNVPVTLAFTYDTGKDYEGQYGPQVFRKTMDGDSVYLSPFVEEELVKMRYKAKTEVVITKCVNGKKTTWDVCRLGEQPERPLAGQPQRVNRSQVPPHQPKHAMACLRALGTPPSSCRIASR